MKIKNLLILSLLVTSSFVNIVLAEEKAAISEHQYNFYTGNFDFTAPENKGHWKSIVSEALDKGYYPYSGKSDSDVMIFV